LSCTPSTLGRLKVTSEAIIPSKGALQRAAQQDSVVQAALQALFTRGRVGEYSRGRSRRSTRYTYQKAWTNFSLFLRYRFGDDATLEVWTFGARDRGSELLDYLDEHVPEVDAADVQAYVEAMLQKPLLGRDGKAKVGLESATVNVRLAALRHLFKTSMRMGLRKDNPAHPDMVDRQRVSNPYAPEGLKAKHVAKLLVNISGDGYVEHRDRMLIMMLAHMGLRREEAVEIRTTDFRDEGEDEGWSLDMLRKGAKRQRVLVPRKLEDALKGYVERWNLTDHIFLTSRTRKPLVPNRVSKMVRARTQEILGVSYSPHALRHTFVTAALDAGVPLHEVQDYVGHENPATTMKYKDRKLDRARCAAEFVDYEED